MKSKAAERYLKEIRKNIGVGGKLKDEYLKGLTERVYEYCEESDSSFDKLCEAFGEPSSLASEFIEVLPEKVITRKLNIRRIILLSLIIALVIYLAFIVISLIDVHQEAHGYFEEEILMIQSYICGGV